MPTIIPEGLENFIEGSISLLDSRRSELESNRLAIAKYFDNHVIPELKLKNVMLQLRVKGSESLREKIIRKDSFNEYASVQEYIHNLPDLIGVRVVCLLDKQEKQVFDKLVEMFRLPDPNFAIGDYNVLATTDGSANHSYIRVNVATNQPEKQKNGLPIYKIPCQWIDTNGQIINVELQIKSVGHSFWGEVEHALFYKNHAYNVGTKFYEEMMKSTRELLKGIDSQLMLISEHLKPDTTEETVLEELKQTLTRMVYNKYHRTVSQSFNCDLDLKYIYRLVVDIFLEGVHTTNQGLSKANQLIGRLNSQNGQLTDESFSFNTSNVQLISGTDEAKELARVLVQLAQGNDLFWITFLALYKTVFEKQDSTLFLEVAQKLLHHYYSVYDEFELLPDTVRETFHSGLLKSVIEVFKMNPKIEYFVDDRPGVLNVMRQIIKHHQLEISLTEEDDSIDDRPIYALAAALSRVAITLTLHGTVGVDCLIILLEACSSQTDWDIYIDNVQLQEFIEQGSAITIDQFNSCFSEERFS